MIAGAVLVVAAVVGSTPIMTGARASAVVQSTAPRTQTCDNALERLCEPARTHGLIQCVECAGIHKAYLPTNCSDAHISSFCTNSSCAARLAQQCPPPDCCPVLPTPTQCVSCANCTHQAGRASGCSPAQQVGFCEAVIPPSPPQPPSCDTVLAHACDAERKQDPLKCALCVGADKNREAAHAASCSDANIEAFCSNATCYAFLAGRCPRAVGGNGCANCSACAVVVAGQSGSAQQCTAAEIETFCAPFDVCAITPAGQVKWTVATGAQVESSPAIADDGTVYVGSDDCKLYAITPTGQVKWTVATGQPVESSPAIRAAISDWVYVGSNDGNLYAITPAGQVMWTIATGAGVDSSPAIADDETVYVGSDDGKLYAILRGQVKWTVNPAFGYDNGVSSPAIADDGTVYVGSGNGRSGSEYHQNLYAITPAGKVKWNVTIGGINGMDSSPAIAADGTVYVNGVVQYNGRLYAITPAGQVKWTVALGQPVESSPAVATDGTVYVGSDKLYAITPAGRIKWTVATGQPIFRSPAIAADSTVYVGSDDHKLYAITPAGQIKWNVTTGARVWSSPVIAADGTMYVGSDDGRLYAICAMG
eukprot:COSAG05_NODE_663_length_8031_cov_8.938225_1_plen_593_part_00